MFVLFPRYCYWLFPGVWYWFRLNSCPTYNKIVFLSVWHAKPEQHPSKMLWWWFLHFFKFPSVFLGGRKGRGGGRPNKQPNKQNISTFADYHSIYICLAVLPPTSSYRVLFNWHLWLPLMACLYMRLACLFSDFSLF